MERFWLKVKITSLHGCWMWTACKNGEGYGRFGFEGKTYYSHRVAYTLIKGSIPKGLDLDHLCRNHSCVNPLHLEAVTRKEHIQRGAGHGGVLSTPKTHCPKGHERTLDNVDSSDHCKICVVERGKEYYAIHKEELVEYQRRYRATHKEEIAERNRKYRNSKQKELNK